MAYAQTPTTWVLVADAGRARVLENTCVGKGLHPALLQDFANPNPPNRAQGTDRPGRNRAPAGSPHGVGSGGDWHAYRKERFAADLAAELRTAHERKAFGRLIVIATPAVLGDVRKALDKSVTGALIGTVDKDLTRATDQEIETAVAGYLAV